MFVVACSLVLLTAGAAPADPAPGEKPKPAEQRSEAEWLNGTAEADQIEISFSGTARLIGHCKIHLERTGQGQGTIDLIADRVTVQAVKDAANAMTVNKLFAVGAVHIDATETDEKAKRVTRLVSDCDRAEYLAKEGRVTLSADAAAPVKATFTQEAVPPAGETLKPEDKHTLILTGRQKVVAYLNEEAAKALEKEEGGG